MSRLDEIKKRLAAATPGPWGWFGNLTTSMYLATRHSGRRYVMQFARLGMKDAQPVFQVYDDPEHPEWGRMVKGSELAIREVEYRDDIVGFDNPDAELIAHAPDDIAFLLAEVERLTAKVGDALFALEAPNGDVSMQHLEACRAALAEALHGMQEVSA